jgi:hypothetical protein
LGIVIGINPSVGITAFLVILLAWAFGLNQIAPQIGAHAMTPLIQHASLVCSTYMI